jgi:acyl-CoA dehydrogenase
VVAGLARSGPALLAACPTLNGAAEGGRQQVVLAGGNASETNASVQGVAAAERGLHETLEYVKGRKAFGKRILDFQNTQFKLAEVKTKLTVARVFVDHCIGLHLKGQLDAVTASMAKYWVTDLENSIIDRCLQFFGGFGYMAEYPIARMYRDSRVQRIYGGANEVMKVLIARTL